MDANRIKDLTPGRYLQDFVNFGNWVDGDHGIMSRATGLRPLEDAAGDDYRHMTGYYVFERGRVIGKITRGLWAVKRYVAEKID